MKINTAYIRSFWSWLQWEFLLKFLLKFRLWIKESRFVENHHKAFTTKMYVTAYKIGTVGILTDVWLWFTFQKKVLQFLRNFRNGVSSCCSRQSIKWRHISLTSKTVSVSDFPSNISAAYVIEKGPQ